ncbi:MMPL family transporter [Novosphingobium sp.]|uniref:MMPL family transporter n=1 Tax=Novosphingobium sp. TaxID=1874826 RepID=UPI0025F7C1C5|nr:MMPL family transporter [Novosphingobium sp.]
MRNFVPGAVASSIKRPWLTVALAFWLAALAVIYTAGHLAMTTDTAELISPKVGWRVHERAMDEAFPQLRDATLVVVDGKTPELAEDGAVRLAAEMAGDARHFRSVRRPDGGDFFARAGLLFSSQTEVQDTTAALIKAQPLLGSLAADPSLRGVAAAVGTMLDGIDNGSATFAQTAAPMRALADAASDTLAGKPVYFSWQRLFAGSTSGTLAPPTRRLILTRPVLDFGSLTPGADAVDAVHAAAGRLGLDAGHGVTVRVTGDVPLADEEFATLQENIGLVGLVMLGAMLVTLWFATRSARLVGAIVGTITLGLAVTLAAGLLTVGRLNLISIAFIPLFVGLGVDFGIQICVRFNHERAQGKPVDTALRDAAAALGPPLLLAAGAVFLGFGAFLPTAYIGIAELGVIAGIGMIIAFMASITLLPALVMLAPPAAPRREVGFAALAPVDRWLARRRKAVLWGFAVSMAISIALLPLVSFDFNPLHLRDPEAPAMRTLADLTRDPDRTPNTIGVLAKDHDEATRLAKALSSLAEVRQVVSLDSFVPGDQTAKLAAISDASLLLDVSINPFDLSPPPPDDTALAVTLGVLAERLARTATAHPGPGADQAQRLADGLARLAHGAAAQRATLDTALAKPLGVMLDQTRAMLQAAPVDQGTLPADLVRDWRTPDGHYRLEVYPAGNANDNAVMQRFRTAVSSVTPNVSGLPVATQAAAGTIAGAFIEAGAIAFLLVSLLLYAVLRNVREVMFTLAPVVLSIFLTLGTCVVIGQPINFANIIAFPLLFGVGVAFHIYFVMAWRGGATDLLQSSLARAVLFSALATGTAFGSLWLSDHPGTASMGKILMISLIWTLICALVFEPALLGPPREKAKAAS